MSSPSCNTHISSTDNEDTSTSSLDNAEKILPAHNNASPSLAEKNNDRFSHPLVDESHGQLIANVSRYLTTEQIQTITKACHFADVAHIKDTRKSGEPYVTHPIAVANILADYQADTDTLVAALLHDTIEDTDVTKQQVIDTFNVAVAELVDGVTKLRISQDKNLNTAATFRKILTATLNDPRVIVVKVADRVHNMSTMGAVKPAKRVSTAKETLKFYLPFARAMGLNDLADTLELLCYENLDAKQYEYFLQQINARQPQRTARKNELKTRFLEKFTHIGISNAKAHSDNIRVHLFREFFKHKSSIQQLFNYYQFTLELANVAECDNLVTFLKEGYNIPSQNITDYIRKPFNGGYQAIHINYKHNNEHLALIIQTNTMYKASRYGVMLGDDAPIVSQHLLQASLKNLHELVDNDCAESTVNALFDYFNKDKIVVTNTAGRVQELPQGACVLDYAYANSTFIGNTAIAATVDGIAVPLAKKLQTGQRVKITSEHTATPQPEWLGFLTTIKARSAVQEWLLTQPNKQQILAGQQSLMRCLRDQPNCINSITDAQWQEVFEWQNVTNKEEVFQRIATGSLIPQLLVTKIFNNQPQHNPIHNVFSTKNKTVVAGTQGINLQYSNCCNPILGDDIVGVFNQNGLEVHRHRCYSFFKHQETHPENTMPLRWHITQKELRSNNINEPLFSAVLCIDKHCNDDQVSQIILKMHELNIGVSHTKNQDMQTFVHLRVMSRKHLARAMRELRSLLDFPSIKRLYTHNSNTIKE